MSNQRIEWRTKKHAKNERKQVRLSNRFQVAQL